MLQRSEKHLEGCPCCDPFLSKVRKIFREDVVCVSTFVPFVSTLQYFRKPSCKNLVIYEPTGRNLAKEIVSCTKDSTFDGLNSEIFTKRFCCCFCLILFA